MLKFIGYEVVFREIPDEVSLAINITNCPNRCKGCHSKKLQEDIGDILTFTEIDGMVSENNCITCVLFMGGDSDLKEINILAQQIKELLKLKVGIYSGNAFKKTIPELNLKYFDYVKVGPYIEECGPLNNENTNQRLYKVKHIFGLNKLINITEKFWNEHKTIIT